MTRHLSAHRLLWLVLLLAIPLSGMARRYTVVVSLDGFRDDYTLAYETPFLDSLARWGVSATMQPSYPSKTFPNHYTLVTGLVPDHHGIIDNKFYDRKSGLTFSLGDKRTKQDPRFWGGEPIWHTASRQGLKCGVVYWPGSDVKIGGRYPDYYHDYETKPLLSFAERIAEVGRYLSLPEAVRPSLVLAYFEEPDHTGHVYGPYAPETRRMVSRMDGVVELLWQTLERLPQRDSINFIVLSDHGMTPIDGHHLVDPLDYVDRSLIERIDYALPTHLWPKPGAEDRVYKALSRMPHVRVWRKGEVPAYLHYGSNANIGDLVIHPDMGWTIGSRAPRLKGTHGYDPTDRDMQVIFRAVGPDFKQGYRRSAPFANTAIYPLLCHLLHIRPADCDGQYASVSDLTR